MIEMTNAEVKSSYEEQQAKMPTPLLRHCQIPGGLKQPREKTWA